MRLPLLFLLASLTATAQEPAPEPASEAPGAPAPEAVAQPDIVPTVPVQADAAPAPPAAGDATQLDDVVVTAQRQVETLQKAAVSIDALEGDDMSKSGIVDIRRLSEKMPSLISNASSGVSTYVRGVGTVSLFSYTDPAVSYNYDGVYIGRATSAFGLFYDLERVELLKGPQGTLYGRNSTGGALNILPAKPDTSERRFAGNFTYGNANAYNLEAAYNLPLGDDSAMRVSALASRADGYMTDGGSDKDLTAARAQWLTALTPELNLRIAGDFAAVRGYGEGRNYVQHEDYDPMTGTYMVTPSGLDRYEGLMSPRSEALRSTFFDPLVGRDLAPLGVQPYMNSHFYGVNAETNWTSGYGTLTVVPAYRAYRLDTLVGNSSPVILDETGSQASLETRFAGADLGIFDYTAGAYLFSEQMASDGAVTQQSIYAHQVFSTRNDSGALFGRLTAHVRDDLRLVGGARYTKDRKHFDGLADGLVLACTDSLAGVYQCPAAKLMGLTRTPEEQAKYGFTVPAQGGPPAPQAPDGTLMIRQAQRSDSNLSEGKLTYRGAVEYDLAQDNLLFGSYETGFRSGGFAIATGYETYRPEEIVAYTIGSKNRFFKALEVNVEAFAYDYKDQQLGRVSVDSGGNQAYIISNVGSSKIRGAEIDTRLVLPTATRLFLALQYLDSRYTSFTYPLAVKDLVPGSTADNAPPPFIGCPYTDNGTDGSGASLGYTVDCSGFPAFNAPEWTLNLGLAQTFALGDYSVIVAPDTQYRSEYAVGFDYLPYQYQEAIWRTNLNVTLAPFASQQRWTATAFVRNIEDSSTLTFAANVRGIDTIGVSEPRTFGARLSYEF